MRFVCIALPPSPHESCHAIGRLDILASLKAEKGPLLVGGGPLRAANKNKRFPQVVSSAALMTASDAFISTVVPVSTRIQGGPGGR